MFEKEAEEYTENPKSAWKQGMTCVGSVRQAFKDGATFGYNKAKEEGKVVVEHFEAYGQCRDSRRIAGLEAENEELKKDKEDLIFVRDQRAKCMCEDKERLSKAKELIRQLCLMVRELNNPNVQLTNVDYSLAEAEQFLKENR